MIDEVRRIEQLVDTELARVRDVAVLPLVQKLRVKPYPVERGWDYGSAGETYICWTVLEHRESNTGIAYCEHGFGPENPWGLVFLAGLHMGIGMGSGWFPRLEIAIKESMAWDYDSDMSQI